MKYLLIALLLVGCAKERYIRFQEDVKKVVMEDHTLSINQKNKVLTITITCTPQPYERRMTIYWWFNGFRGPDHVAIVKAGAGGLVDSSLSSDGTLTNYYSVSFTRFYN